jgi:hypothetical protein
VARKKRTDRRQPKRSRYPWHRRLPIPAILAGAVLVVVVGLVASNLGVFGSEGRYVPGGGVGEHRAVGTTIAYASYPPTSGPHWDTPASWGFHTDEVADEAAVHNLEHGGVVASYNNISAGDLAALRTLLSSYPRDQYGEVKLLIRPYTKITAGTLVLTAWNWVEDLPGYDDARVRAFLGAHLNKCCEQTP